MAEDSPFTVDADWLEQRLGQPGLSIVDASWYLPAQKRDARKEYDAAHIPGAVFLDHDAVSDRNSPLPHTLAAPRDFAQYVGSMGISADDTIVVYDGPGFFSAPRAWWMFRVMGVFQTYILDGGFDHWKAAGRPVTAEPTKTAPGIFHADFDAARVASLADMRRMVASGEPDRGRPFARSFCRRRAGAARWRARWPYAGRPQRSLQSPVGERHAVAEVHAARSHRGCWH